MAASIWAPNGFSPELRPFVFFETLTTGGQSKFSIAPYTVILPSQIKVFINGEIQKTSSFGVEGTIVTLPAQPANTFVRIEVYLSVPEPLKQSNTPLLELANTVLVDVIVQDGNNALSVGPLEILPGAEVVIPASSRWVIV